MTCSELRINKFQWILGLTKYVTDIFFTQRHRKYCGIDTHTQDVELIDTALVYLFEATAWITIFN